MRSLFLVLSLTACATASEPVSPVRADVVVAAERAFAARGGEIGWVAAFREYAAPDGLIGDFQSAPEAMAATPDQGARNLFWWPVYAGVSRSGDLGFTTGPFSGDEMRTPRGQYFTVWRRQADGSWKWIWDGGVGPVSDPGPVYASASLALLPTASSGVGAERARGQVEAIERSFTDRTVLGYLAVGVHAYRTGQARAIGQSAATSTVAATSPTYEIVRLESSEAGDMVFVLGRATWAVDGQERQGQFARIWQLQPAGWRIVFDQLSVQPPR